MRGVVGHLQQLDGRGAWAYRVHSENSGQTKVGETAEVGEPRATRGDEKAVVVFTLLVQSNSQVNMLLLCGVAVARKKAKGGEPVNDMLPPHSLKPVKK